MSRLLCILSLLLKLAAGYIDLFEAGWRIEVYSDLSKTGKYDLKSVKHWWNHLARGIRYCRGTEGGSEKK